MGSNFRQYLEQTNDAAEWRSKYEAAETKLREKDTLILLLKEKSKNTAEVLQQAENWKSRAAEERLSRQAAERVTNKLRKEEGTMKKALQDQQRQLDAMQEQLSSLKRSFDALQQTIAQQVWNAQHPTLLQQPTLPLALTGGRRGRGGSLSPDALAQIVSEVTAHGGSGGAGGETSGAVALTTRGRTVTGGRGDSKRQTKQRVMHAELVDIEENEQQEQQQQQQQQQQQRQLSVDVDVEEEERQADIDVEPKEVTSPQKTKQQEQQKQQAGQARGREEQTIAALKPSSSRKRLATANGGNELEAPLVKKARIIKRMGTATTEAGVLQTNEDTALGSPRKPIARPLLPPLLPKPFAFLGQPAQPSMSSLLAVLNKFEIAPDGLAQPPPRAPPAPAAGGEPSERETLEIASVGLDIIQAQLDTLLQYDPSSGQEKEKEKEKEVVNKLVQYVTQDQCSRAEVLNAVQHAMLSCAAPSFRTRFPASSSEDQAEDAAAAAAYKAVGFAWHWHRHDVHSSILSLLARCGLALEGQLQGQLPLLSVPQALIPPSGNNNATSGSRGKRKGRSTAPTQDLVGITTSKSSYATTLQGKLHRLVLINYLQSEAVSVDGQYTDTELFAAAAAVGALCKHQDKEKPDAAPLEAFIIDLLLATSGNEAVALGPIAAALEQFPEAIPLWEDCTQGSKGWTVLSLLRYSCLQALAAKEKQQEQQKQQQQQGKAVGHPQAAPGSQLQEIAQAKAQQQQQQQYVAAHYLLELGCKVWGWPGLKKNESDIMHGESIDELRKKVMGNYLNLASTTGKKGAKRGPSAKC